MRQVLFVTLALVGLAGCQTNTQQENDISKTQEWLAKFPDFAEYDTRGFIRELNVPLDQFIKDWLEEGRKIERLSDAMVKILSKKDPPARAIFAAGEFRIKECTPCIFGHLNDERLWYRIYSASSLGLIGDPAAIPELGRPRQER